MKEWTSRIGNTGRPLLISLERDNGPVEWSELSGPGGIGSPVMRMRLRAGTSADTLTIPLVANDDPNLPAFNARVVFTPELFEQMESGRYVAEIDAHHNGVDFTSPEDDYISLRFSPSLDPYVAPTTEVVPVTIQAAASGAGTTIAISIPSVGGPILAAAVGTGSTIGVALGAGAVPAAGAATGAGSTTTAAAGSVTHSVAAAGTGSTTAIAAGTGAVALQLMSMPGSGIVPMSEVQLDNRAYVSGRLARQWWIANVGAGGWLVVYRQNDHSANPQDVSSRMSDTALAARVNAATVVEIDLGNVSRTSAEVVQLTVDGLVLAGATASVYGTVPAGPITAGRSIIGVDCDSITIPPAVDMTDLERRGRFGTFRTMFNGDNQDATQVAQGAVTGRYLQHHDPFGAALGAYSRILGSYIWTGSPNPHGVTIGTGAFSTTPSVDIVASTTCNEISPGGLAYCSSMLTDAVVTDDVSGIWQIVSPTLGPSSEDIGYRAESDTPLAPGTYTNEGLYDPNGATPMGDPYVPGSPSTFSVRWTMGLIVELEDAAGNFRADGSLEFRFGAQGRPYYDDGDTIGVDAPTRGNPIQAPYGLLDSEMTIHTTEWQDIEDLHITAVRRAGMRGGPGDGCHAALIGLPAANVPGVAISPGPVVIHDLGWMPVAVQNGWNEITFDPPLPCGSDYISLAATPYVGLGFTYGTSATKQLDVILDNLNVGADGWEDETVSAPHLAGTPYFPADATERMNFHDDALPYNEDRGLPSGNSEYAIQDSPTLPMGANAADPMPSPLHPDGAVGGGGSVTNPAAIAHDQLVVWSPGFEIYVA